ncbi:MAG TPA: hypothetical protein VGP07_13685 [Polyangia bacterium]
MGLIAVPSLLKWRDGQRLSARLSALSVTAIASRVGESSPAEPAPALLVRIAEIEPLLTSWQTIGGCGAGAGAGAGAGVKWIGRNVSGGLFNVQEQGLYTKLGSAAYPEYNFFFNTLITSDVTEKWNVGVNLPLVYKYLKDPQHLAPSLPAVDWSNGGLGDVSLQATRRLGRINALSLTGIVGLPTGKYNATFTAGGTPLNQNSQLGFGRPTGTLVLDETLDKVWGLVVLGGLASYRGGKNNIDNYRAPSATAYGYAGYFLGPFVPAFGLSLTGFSGHDRDQNSQQNTPLVSVAANASIEWTNTYCAVLLAGSLPYKWDGVYRDDSNNPRSPWGFVPWTVALGIAAAPF